ncbi:RICIN domain-containing protein [Streptomyces platensis]|uniref:RICIN domain-containing protein n=1 Tax=Streptomyces platensis TaxID=58346 RepID=UPI002ED53D4D|nr:RICIN domain-containing protein [Streptomyces platensis]
MLLSIVLTGLGITASPLVAGTAQAAGPQCDETSVLGCLDLASTISSGTMFHLGLENEGSSENGTRIYARKGDAAGEWRFRVNEADGTFQIVNNGTGKCVEAKHGNDGPQPVLWDCTGADVQKFYVHKENDQGEGDYRSNYRIRSVSDNWALEAQRNAQSDPGPATFRPAYRTAAGQVWYAAAMKNSTSTLPTGELDRIATLHTLKQFDANSSAIKEAKYSITDSTQKATLGDYQLVSISSDKGGSSPYCSNHSGPSGGNMTCGFSWQQSVADTIGSSHTAGISATVGTNSKSPVAASTTATYSHTWSESKTTTATSGSNVTIDIPPGQTAWLARAMAFKTVTGTWTITNDIGVTWTGQGTSTKPIEGIDGQSSDLAKCTTDSTNPGCKATAPGAAVN